jgi:hypothetical protein
MTANSSKLHIIVVAECIKNHQKRQDRIWA